MAGFPAALARYRRSTGRALRGRLQVQRVTVLEMKASDTRLEEGPHARTAGTLGDPAIPEPGVT